MNEQPAAAGAGQRPAPEKAPRLDQPLPRPSGGASGPRRPRVVTQKERDEAMNLPLVREIADKFEARLVDLRPRPPIVQPPLSDSETPDREDDEDV